MALLFPEEGLVFDYRLEDGGISSTSDEDDEEEEGKQVTEAWSQEKHREGGREGGGQVVAVLLNGCRGEALLMATDVTLGLFASSHESSQTRRVVTTGSISKTRKLGLRTVTPSSLVSELALNLGLGDDRVPPFPTMSTACPILPLSPGIHSTPFAQNWGSPRVEE